MGCSPAWRIACGQIYSSSCTDSHFSRGALAALRFHFYGRQHSRHACFQKCLSIQSSEQVQFFRDQPGPSSLVAGANARTIVALEVFVEPQVIAEIGIRLELFDTTENGPPP